MRLAIVVRAFIPFVAAFILSACVSSSEPVASPRPAGSRPALPAPRPAVPAYRPAPVYGTLSERPPVALEAAIRTIWRTFPGRTGIAIVRDDATWTVGERSGEAMPQQSVSKLWVAITLLDMVDRGDLDLSEPVTVRKADLVVFSNAMAGLIGPEGYRTTLGGLLERSMLKSDNTANDVLLRRVGGPQAVRAMIANKGLGAIRFSAGENLMQAATAGIPWREEYREGRKFQAVRALLSETARRQAMDAYVASPSDGATPVAIARALLRLSRGELLQRNSTQRLMTLMTLSETGKQRLRAGVPLGWSFAHKTGTGQDHKGRTAGYNDVGVMTAPDGTRYGVAVLIADTSQTVPTRMQLMQSVSAAIGAAHEPYASGSPPRYRR